MTNRGLPGAPQSVRFTGAQSGRAVVEATHCSSKANCAPNPITYLTSDGGRACRR